MLSYATLQEGYRVLRSLSDGRKESLRKNLQDGKSISAADEAWLDMDANLIDEELALNRLKDVENLRETIESLPDHLRNAVENLITAGSPPGESNAVNLQT